MVHIILLIEWEREVLVLDGLVNTWLNAFAEEPPEPATYHSIVPKTQPRISGHAVGKRKQKVSLSSLMLNDGFGSSSDCGPSAAGDAKRELT